MNFLTVLSVFILLVAYSKVLGSENQDDLQENEELTSPKEGMARKKGLSHVMKRSVAPLKYSYNQLMKTYMQHVKRRLSQFPDGEARQRSFFLIDKLPKNWNNTARSLAFRAKKTTALTAAKENIDALYNSPNNPTASFLAVMKLIEALYKVTAKTRPFTNKPALFLCSIISLFSEARLPQQYFRRVMFPKGIPKTIEELQMNGHDEMMAGETFSKFWSVKKYINANGINREKIGSRLASMLTSKVNKNVVHEWQFSRSLEVLITDVVNANDSVEAKLSFDLVDYYVKFSILRELLLITAKGILPRSNRMITENLNKAIKQIEDKDMSVLRFLYDPDVYSKLMPYFDWKDYPITNTYMSIILGITRPPDKFPGLSCIGTDKNPRASAWDAVVFPGNINPIFAWDNDRTPACHWRIISHAQNLYSIVYKPGLSNCPWSGALLAIDARKHRRKILVGLNLTKSVLWEFINSNTKENDFKIITRRFCGANCNKYLNHMPIVKHLFVGRLFGGTKGHHTWKITQAPSASNMTSKSSTADKKQLLETDENGELGDTSVNKDESGIQERSSEPAEKVSGNTIQA